MPAGPKSNPWTGVSASAVDGEKVGDYDEGREVAVETYIVPVQVQPLEDSEGYLAICPILPGCHAEGKTYAQAIDNLEDVARAHIELRLEKGLPLPEGLRPFDREQHLVLEGQMPVPVRARDRQVA